MKKFFRISILWLVILAILCPVFVFAGAAAYDPATEGIVSSYYYIDREKAYITGVAPGTSAGQLLNVCLPNDCTLSQQKLTTGTTLSSGEHALTVIVTGDLNGDGAVTITDMLMQKSAILGDELSATATAAGDINYDGGITITDFLQVKSALIGLSSITDSTQQNVAAAGPVILLTPNACQSWQGGEGAASYTCDNPSIAAVDENGTITGHANGSSFIYALDVNGSVLSRIMVSVIDEPLTVSLNVSQQSMTPGQKFPLIASFNHPVTAPVTWSSSDESVVTVTSEGTVAAQNYGKAVITATLPNGSFSQTAINVAPSITTLSFDRELYKVKPGNYRYPKLSISPAQTDEEIIWSSSDPSIATVSNDGTVYGVSYGTVTVTATGKYSGLSASCQVSVCDVRQVAISFDDGPGANTAWLLDYLKSKNIRVTFFLIGNLISHYPETVSRQAAEGHEIGYHSYSHQNQLRLSSEQIISDFAYTNSMFKDLTGKEFTLWRSPGGNYDQRVLNCIQLPHIYWSVDTRDWESRNADSIYRLIVNNTVDGSIVLMHDIYGSTIEGAIRGIDALIAAGYEFLTVSELLGRDGDPAQNCINYYND